MHPLHPAGRTGWGSARRPLDGPGKDRVRDQLAATGKPPPASLTKTLSPTPNQGEMSETMAELSLTLSERHTADFEMIGNGGFAPLAGFQGSADWERVCSEMRTTDGDYWPIPITLASEIECEVGDTIALSSDEGKALGRLRVEEIWDRDVKVEAEKVY